MPIVLKPSLNLEVNMDMDMDMEADTDTNTYEVMYVMFWTRSSITHSSAISTFRVQSSWNQGLRPRSAFIDPSATGLNLLVAKAENIFRQIPDILLNFCTGCHA